jgi:predicted negative regulator of RcsB-dependent stress response
MSDPMIWMMVTTATLAGLVVIAVTTLKGWRDWIALQTRALEGASRGDAPSGSAGARIELADLKERIRKLEAIAAGVDF